MNDQGMSEKYTHCECGTAYDGVRYFGGRGVKPICSACYSSIGTSAEIDGLRAQLAAAPKRTPDGTTCWSCEVCGKTRTGRECVTCLRNELAAAKADVHDMFTRGDAYMHKSDRMEQERDALAGLLREAMECLPHPSLQDDVFGRDLVDRISAALDGKGGGDGWVSTAERMPMQNPYSSRVLIAAKYGDEGQTCIKMGWCIGNEWRYDGQRGLDPISAEGWVVTHWRPLPALPTPPATPTKDAR